MRDSSWPKARATSGLAGFGRKALLLTSTLLFAAVMAACSHLDTQAPYSNGDLSVEVYEGDEVGSSRVTNVEEGTVAGKLAIRVTTHKHSESVAFYLDDPEMVSTPAHVESIKPFTFLVDTTTLANGPHSVTIVSLWKNGRTSRPITIDFTVDNEADPATGPGDPDPQPDPDPSPDPKPDPEPEPEPQPSPVKGTLFVATNGSDSNDGRSISRPLRTIARAARLVRPGDVLQIRGGVYPEYIGPNHWEANGREGAPITVMAYPGEKVIIDGGHIGPNSSNPSSPTLIRLVDRDWYIFQDLTLRNSGGRAITLRGDNHVIRNVVAHSNHGDGIYVAGSYNLIEDSISYDNYSHMNGGDSADGVKLVTGTGNVVRRVVAYENSDDGIDIWDTTNTLVEYNIAYRNGRGYSGNGNGFKLSAGSRANAKSIVRNNVAYDNRAFNFTDNGGGGLTAYNNTSVRGGERGYVFRGRTGQTQHVLANNISYQDSRGNLIDVQSSGGVTPDQERNTWNLGISDPRFISTNPDSSGFLRLASDSPAIDAGVDLGMPYKGKAPDLGAFQTGF